MKTMRILLFFWACLLMALPVEAQKYMFKQLEVKDGLPNNQVNAIYKDSRGFMWFGTASGLARYDGYSFKTFRSKVGDKTSLTDNYVESIAEDGRGYLWIRAGGGEYVIYDSNTQTFNRDVRAWMWNVGVDGVPQMLYIDRQKVLWFYVEGKGLYRYAEGDERAVCLSIEEGKLPYNRVTDITECGEGILFVYDNGRVVCADRARPAVRWMLSDVTESLRKDEYESFFLFVDSDEDLWIYSALGTWTYSLKERKWHPELVWTTGNQSHDMVTAIAESRNGLIWLGKNQNGLELLNKKTGEKVHLNYQPDNTRGLPNNTINALFEDEDGVMWIGTYKKGAAYYDESIYKFGLHHVGDVNCIEEDRDGALWLGTNDGGLIHWNPRTGEKKVYAHQGENSLTTDVVVCLLKASDGKLWIGTFWGGLDCFDGQRFIHYKNRPDDPNSLANNNVWALAEDRKGNIWIGTLGGGVQCLNPKTGKFKTYNMGNSGIISNHIASICITHDDRLVIGTASSGVVILDLNTEKITNLVGTQSGEVRFSNQSVNQVYEDSRGLIWIGTRDGLNLYNPRNDRLQLASPSKNTPEQFISAIVEDEFKNMWVTTAKGVMNIVPSMDGKDGGYNFDFHLYDDKDGLQSCEFNQRSIKQLASGEIVMGGLYGINTFKPGNIKYNRTLPKVMFTEFDLFNEEVKIGKEYGGRVVLTDALDRVEEVQLNYEQNVFTVMFASDNYILPDKTRYLYKLEGFNNDYMFADADMHRVTYTNLAPGTYQLKVKAINSDGYIGSEEAGLKIVILPPFWRTPLAYVCYGLLLIGVLLLAYYMVRRREQNKFKIRQMEQEAKTAEEVNQMKFRFFTNVSHELRTPLTLIISPLEEMIKSTADERQQGRLKLMHRNAVRLLNLVNQLLDFRKIEMAGLHLSLSEGDVITFVHNICNSFLMLSEKKNVHLTFFSAEESLHMAFDEDKIGKVVMNLLSNAFKFTPEGGRVDVSLERVKGNPETLLIKVSDTGVGVKDEDKERIFERFYQVENKGGEHPTTGSGIGLSLVRDFVTLHGGSVRVLDNVGSGSVFVVSIPVKHVEVTPKDGDLSEETVVPVSDPQPLSADADGHTGDADAVEDKVDEKKKPLALIVDDNEDLVNFMKDSLRLYFRIQTAANGREAWQMIPDLMPDIIVSDVMMPEMDGNELCRLVKTDKRTAGIPLILLTAKRATEDRVEGLKTGADDYVTKPFNVEVLILRMRKLIDLSSRNRPRTHIDPEPTEIVITSLDEKLVENAIKYVEENISRPDLSVEELSQALGMSRVHLYKKLSQITGKTPIEFIRIIRLKRAAQLLRESQLNVSEIAFQLGFNNPKYFTKYFKDEFGVLPSVYQEREGK
ncbi:MAG: two-component regulator propeller domain-containing protein [Bacteroides sp.]|nr:two-component regulator propeller domain-containing protein [Bacteroides sp.]